MSVQKVRSVLQSILDVSSIDDDETLFSLGISSLSINKFLHALKRDWGIQMDFVNFFENSSIRELAAFINRSAEPAEA